LSGTPDWLTVRLMADRIVTIFVTLKVMLCANSIMDVDAFKCFLSLDNVCVLVGTQMRLECHGMLPCSLKRTTSWRSPLTITSRMENGTSLPLTNKIDPWLASLPWWLIGLGKRYLSYNLWKKLRNKPWRSFLMLLGDSHNVI
jgi:hypothetical protein